MEYAYRYRDAYQCVLWVQANTQEILLSNFVALAGLLHLPEQTAQEQQLVVQALHHWFETHSSWLLIFDNADDLAMIQDYLPQGNQGHIVLTTRAQAMGGLARKIELDTMGPEEGAAFLLRRAGIIAQDAILDSASPADRALAREIVHAMDGLPLALDQAGAYLEETGESLSNYLALYQQQRAALLKRRGGLVLTRGGFSGKGPARRRRTEGTHKGPRIHPQPPLPLQQPPAWSVERQGWSGGGGALAGVLLARCPAITHKCRGEREGVPDGQAFCLYQWQGISGMMGAGQSREGKGGERGGWLQRSRSRGKGTPIVGSPSASRAMIIRNPDRIL